MKEVLEAIRGVFVHTEKKTILVIDDSELDRKTTSGMLTGRFKVLCATGGREGIAMACAHRPDLILLDFMMPDLKGPEVCRLLKDDPRTRDIPVIFLTSMDTPNHMVDSFEQGAEVYLTKPVSRAELVKQALFSIETADSQKE